VSDGDTEKVGVLDGVKVGESEGEAEAEGHAGFTFAMICLSYCRKQLKSKLTAMPSYSSELATMRASGIVPLNRLCDKSSLHNRKNEQAMKSASKQASKQAS
jgi:hypothetical protein